MDDCDRCEALVDGEVVDIGAAPYVTDVKDGWVDGQYRCENGHKWTCSYTLGSPFLGY